jgi:hypothetical protein
MAVSYGPGINNQYDLFLFAIKDSIAFSDVLGSDIQDDLFLFPIKDLIASSNTPASFLHTEPNRLDPIRVKIACVKCHQSSKKCDSARPCLRCLKKGFGFEDCVDFQVFYLSFFCNLFDDLLLEKETRNGIEARSL